MKKQAHPITKKECMKLVLARVPDFKVSWQAHLKYWEGEEAGLCNDMAAFARYIAGLGASGRDEDFVTIKAALDLAEELMTEGDEEVRTAVATCFLENLSNRAASGSIRSQTFLNLLGPKSRAYWEAWDNFTNTSGSVQT